MPSPFRLRHLEPYAEAARTWLHRAAEVVDTTHLTPAEAAAQIVAAVEGGAVRPVAVPGADPAPAGDTRTGE